MRVKVVPVDASSSRDSVAPPVIAFDSDAYYCPIIAYNIFRPLGWTPPRPVEPYRLIGTILPRDTNTPATAIIETTTGNTRHIVTLGDALSTETKVVSIESKSVVLEKDGKQRTLRLPSGF